MTVLRETFEVRIPCAGAAVAARLTLPDAGRGVVAVPRHGAADVAAAVCAERAREAGLGVLEVDLAAIGEPAHAVGADAADRLADALAWLDQETATCGRPIGVFASDGLAGSALAAAARSTAVAAVAVVFTASASGADALAPFAAPTLLLAVDGDEGALHAARATLARIAGDRWLEPVRDPTEAGRAAAAWFATRCGGMAAEEEEDAQVG